MCIRDRDDNLELCKLIRTALERDGHRVETRPAGGELTEALCRGADCIYSRKRPVLAPGEMETVRLKAELLRGPGDAVTVTLEEG